MPTKKPRVTFALSEEELAVIDKYRFDNHLKNQTQAILSLISIGLDTLAPPLPQSSINILSREEQQLVEDYRSLNKKGREYILQTMTMARQIYSEKNDAVPEVETA